MKSSPMKHRKIIFEALTLNREMEKRNAYVNALKAENERLRKQLDAAVEDINASANDPYHCGICKKQHIKCEANPDGSCQFEWRGAERSGQWIAMF